MESQPQTSRYGERFLMLWDVMGWCGGNVCNYCLLKEDRTGGNDDEGILCQDVARVELRRKISAYYNGLEHFCLLVIVFFITKKANCRYKHLNTPYTYNTNMFNSPKIPTLTGLSALGGLATGGSAIRTVNDIKNGREQLAEATRHSRHMQSMAILKSIEKDMNK
uniref:Uncharacterized protein n=1 Tax=Glossina pallidipes TaxID=7398 RepID=A0A1A9ZDT8_GLOPL